MGVIWENPFLLQDINLTMLEVKEFGLFAARIGIAFTFCWAGTNKINHSESSNLGQYLLNSIGFDPTTTTQIVTGMGSLELLFGILIAIGLLTRLSAAFMIIILISSQAMFSFNYTQGPAIWKDPGLLGLAILLLLSGAGKFSIDYLISKRSKIYQCKDNILEFFLFN